MELEDKKKGGLPSTFLINHKNFIVMKRLKSKFSTFSSENKVPSVIDCVSQNSDFKFVIAKDLDP